MRKTTQKKTRVRLSAEQKKQRAKKQTEARMHNSFKKKYHTIFTMASFTKLTTENRNFKIGNKEAEVDCVFVHRNILVVVEETMSSSNYIKDHIIKKCETAREIECNKKEFLSFLYDNFPQETSELKEFEPNEIKFKFLYFSFNETNLSTEDRKRFLPWVVVKPNVLSYLYKCAIGIKKSVKYEVFRFLGVADSDFEVSSSAGQGSSDVKVSIIYPQKSTGRKDGVRLVSFMISADTLIRNSYVLRKDNWEDSIGLYQRLIDLDKIKDIRRFLYQKGECFYNNIIVGLPDGIRFTDNNGNVVDLDSANTFNNYTMHIPNKMNSICVIDGQHRIFAHYEGEDSDPMEEKIARLRKQLHLLVTGLIFPIHMTQSERIRIQSEIFAEINSKSKRIPPDVLLHIEMLREPLSDISLARQVLEKLNKSQMFFNCFEFSPLKPAKLKVASIIKFALKYLVSLTPGEGKDSLYTVWNNAQKQDIFKDDHIRDLYLEYCEKFLIDYFSAIKQVYTDQWEDDSSKILSVITFNSFILALKKDLTQHGAQNRDYYLERYSKYKFNFSRTEFLFTSSQYNKFSEEIMIKCFNQDDQT